VFPQAFKASPLLRAWLRRLDASGVRFALRHRWTGWDDHGRLLFQTPGGQRAIEARATVAGARRASWPRLGLGRRVGGGARGEGCDHIAVAARQLRLHRAWSDIFRNRFEGQPLKGIALRFGLNVVRGEAVVTRNGIEGGAIYALSAELREAMIKSREAMLHVALRPISTRKT